MLLTWFLNNVMEEELTEHLNPEAYERADGRICDRNGIKRKKLKTEDGGMLLDKPDIILEIFEINVIDRHQL